MKAEMCIRDRLNCDPMSFDKECELTNAHFHKNKKRADIKSHHYIISYDPADVTAVSYTHLDVYKRQEHTLTTSISRIRSKIEADGDTYIKTVYGMGYQWTGGEKK